MAQLVTLEDVMARLNILHYDDTDALEAWIEGAEQAVLNFLGTQGQSGWYDGALMSGATVPPVVATAVVMLVGYMYRSPDRDEDAAFGHGTLPKPVTSILWQLRDPALS